MGRIIFLNPFGKGAITGGVKTAYKQVEILEELGFDAWVYQPEGMPGWFKSHARIMTSWTAPGPKDVLVFPETINGPLTQMIQARYPSKKVLFCQAQYYAIFSELPVESCTELFDRVVCQSKIAKGFMERVFGLKNVGVIPCYVDSKLFYPRGNAMQVALIPRKLPREAAAIAKVFGLKYPQHRSVPWAVLQESSEQVVAQTFGQSAIVLSLPFLESFGLVPLEAMASGAIVIGFHGYGAQEYATDENGMWFPSDHIEETADAVARVISGLKSRDPATLKIRDAGFVTAGRYNKERTRAALREFYGPLVA